MLEKNLAEINEANVVPKESFKNSIDPNNNLKNRSIDDEIDDLEKKRREAYENEYKYIVKFKNLVEEKNDNPNKLEEMINAKLAANMYKDKFEKLDGKIRDLKFKNRQWR